MSQLDAVILNEIKKLASASGGGGSINSSAPLCVGGIDMYSGNGEVWLRTGVLSTEVGSYPNAYKTYHPTKTVPPFATANYQAFAYVNNEIWCMASGSDKLQKKDLNLNTLSGSIRIRADAGGSLLTWNSAESCFVYGTYASDSCYKVGLDGVEKGKVTFSGLTLIGVAFGTDSYWVMSGGIVSKRNLAGAALGVMLTLPAGAGAPVAIDAYGGKVYVLTGTSGRVYIFSEDGTYNGIAPPIPLPDQRVALLVVGDLFFFAAFGGYYRYEGVVGDPIAKYEVIKLAATATTATERGNPIYIRIS